MLRRYLLLVSTCLALLLSGASAFAQSEVLVSGRVTSKSDKGPLAGTEIYIFKTVGDGLYEFDRAQQMYESGYVPEGLFKYVMSRQDGEYELTIPDSGSLIFYKHPFKPVFVKVRGRNNIDVVIDATRILDEATVVAEGKKMTKKGKVVGFGNKFAVKNFPYFIKKEKLGDVEGPGRTNARLVTQLFLINADGTDTLEYFTPRVYDGEQFHQTQYHWRRDTLYHLAEHMPRLTADRDSLMFNIQFNVDHPEELYFCKAHIWIEDYIKTYYCDTLELLNTGRVSRPFQFLEYSLGHGELDPMEYYKEPRRERITTPKTMKLKFKVESAQLDMTDAQTVASLDSLKNELAVIVADPASVLKEIHFHGFASPEGPYKKNQDLAHRRTATVKENVLSCLPSRTLDRVYSTSRGEVSPWALVAEHLEADSQLSDAKSVRDIIAQHPQDIGAQGFKIRKLKNYKRTIVPYLRDLRMVKCEYIAEVSRFLTPDEILARYNSDPDFATGVKDLTLNEYWHLFKLIKDKDELEKLYKLALDASLKAEREYWALPANLLAVNKLERKELDTLLLKPFINEQRTLNYSEMDMQTGVRRTVNADAIIVNQIMMFMLAKNYVRAEEMSSIIASKHPMLRAVVRCIGGYMDFANPEDRQLMEKISQSSPRNKVIMNLYAERFDSTTVNALNSLPADDALTLYLKAQRLCLQYSNQAFLMRSADFNREEDPDFKHPDEVEFSMDEPIPYSVYEVAYIYLKRCFEKDRKFILTAKADADINEDLLNDVLGIKQEKK